MNRTNENGIKVRPCKECSFSYIKNIRFCGIAKKYFTISSYKRIFKPHVNFAAIRNLEQSRESKTDEFVSEVHQTNFKISHVYREFKLHYKPENAAAKHGLDLTCGTP